jgi:cell shape-determining protein MreC
MARLIQRVNDPEKLNQMLKESSRLSSRAWAEVESLRKENKVLRNQLWDLKNQVDWGSSS